MTFPDCEITVREAERCAEAQGAQTDQEICDSVQPVECEPLVAPNCF